MRMRLENLGYVWFLGKINFSLARLGWVIGTAKKTSFWRSASLVGPDNLAHQGELNRLALDG